MNQNYTEEERRIEEIMEAMRGRAISALEQGKVFRLAFAIAVRYIANQRNEVYEDVWELFLETAEKQLQEINAKR